MTNTRTTKKNSITNATTKSTYKKWQDMTEEEKANAKKAKQEKLNELENILIQGVKETLQSDNYKEYLRFMNNSYFTRYSPRNLLMILFQAMQEGYKPSYVKGFQSWKKEGRYVKKGAKSLRIFAPCQRKYTKTETDENGNEIEKEYTYNSYKAEYVFDISQTEGKEAPTICNPLRGSVDNFEKLIDVLIKVAPCPVYFDDFDIEAYGFYHIEENYIKVKTGISQEHAAKTLIHEIAHAIMHNRQIQGLENVTNSEKEVQALYSAFQNVNHFKEC